MKFRSIKGTKDILPEESHRWRRLEETVRSVMHAYNFREIRTPAFEDTSLFARGIGELTDIVGKEMYTFADRGGESVTLKPEMTASVVRAFIQHALGERSPLLKVYYIAPMFRQERPQAGRLRQFHQYGAELFGSPDADADAEVIALAMTVTARLGVERASLRINSVGCAVCRPPYREMLRSYFEGVRDKLSGESLLRLSQNPMRILDSKDPGDRSAAAGAPLMKDQLCGECAPHFSRLQEILSSLEIPFEVDGSIVRGLDYYTRTAFEVTSTDLGSQDALAGGGRYDLLVEELGGKPTPAVGFAAGLERLLMVLERQQGPGADDAPPRVYLVAADEAGRNWAAAEAYRLRAAGVRCERDLLGRSLKAQMREADRQKADFVAVVGGEEIRNGSAILKEMKSGAERRVDLSAIVRALSDPA